MRPFSSRAVFSMLAPVGLLASQLCLFYPLELYLKNVEEVTVNLRPFCLSLLPGFLLVTIALCLPYAIQVQKFRQCYKYFLSVLAVLAWINANFLFGDYGPLDGRGLDIERYSLLSATQLVVCLVVFGLVFASKRVRGILDRAVLVVLCILIVSLAVNMVTFVQAGGAENQTVSSQDFHQSLLEFSPEKNIIHIVLDEFQSDIMEEILDHDASWEKELDGFYFFENTAAVYPTTVMAIPNLLSGKVYKNEIDKDLYLDEVFVKNGYFQSLDQQGYRRDFHLAVSIYCGKKRLQNCTPIFDDTSIVRYKLLDIALYKTVPDLIKPYIYNDERWLLRSIFSRNKGLAYHGGKGLFLWRKYINEINIDAVQPTYKFFHSAITHSPMVLSENCEIQSAGGATLSNIKQQSICGLRQVKAFLQRLRELDIYESSYIVVSSDHGSNYVAAGFEVRFEGRDIEPVHYSRSRALLMIKPVASSGGLVRTRRPASLQDIPQTVLANNNLLPIAEGVDVFSLSERQSRKRQFIYYDWVQRNWSMSTLPPLKIYEIDGPIGDPNSWPNSTDQILRRKIRCGERVNFGVDLSTDVLSSVGLSKVEPWGRWSNRSKVIVKFKLGDTPCENRVLKLTARAFVTEANPIVKARVLLNDEQIGTMTFRTPSDQLFTFTLGNLLRENAVNALFFDIDGVISPAELGISSDTRQLGIGFVELSLE